MRALCLLTSAILLAGPGLSWPAQPQVADAVLVIKSERRLYLLKDGDPFAEFRVTFGTDPVGHKQRKGDNRTPEGKYVLDWKHEHSDYYKAIHVSYPNAQDQAEATRRGEDPGGSIMIHGQKNGYEWLSPISKFFNWTDGCIALTNTDMEKVWLKVQPGTPIEIMP